MTGIIDVGGGMKCAYSAGLYDYFIDNDIKFDYYLGVSAGSMNLMSYIAGEKGRNIEMYRQSAVGNEYLSLANFIQNGTYMNYEKVRRDFFSSEGDRAFNFGRVFDFGGTFNIAATVAETGETVFFGKNDYDKRPDRLLDIVSASCCIPIVSKPIVIDGVEYFDGGITEPVPYLKAFLDGCDKIVVVLSAPADHKRRRLVASGILGDVMTNRNKEYDEIAEAFEERHIIYNYTIKVLKKLEAIGKVMIISPDDIPGTGALVKDVDVVEALYENGIRDGSKYRETLFHFLQCRY